MLPCTQFGGGSLPRGAGRHQAVEGDLRVLHGLGAFESGHSMSAKAFGGHLLALPAQIRAISSILVRTPFQSRS